MVQGRRDLTSAAGRLLDEHAGALPQATPLEAYLARQAVAAGVEEALGGLLTDAQREAWARMQSGATDLLRGESDRFRFGLQEEGREARSMKEILDHWNEHYELPPERQAALKEVGDAFLASAKEALRRFGQLDDPPRALSAAEKKELELAFLSEQLEAESRLLPFLDEEALGKLRKKRPTLIQFENSRGTDRRVGGPGGF